MGRVKKELNKGEEAAGSGARKGYNAGKGAVTKMEQGWSKEKNKK